MTDGKAQRPEESAQREARSEPIPTPEGQGGGEDARELAQRVIDTWGDGNPPIVVLARALLSSPRVEEKSILEMIDEIKDSRSPMPHVYRQGWEDACERIQQTLCDSGARIRNRLVRGVVDQTVEAQAAMRSEELKQVVDALVLAQHILLNRFKFRHDVIDRALSLQVG